MLETNTNLKIIFLFRSILEKLTKTICFYLLWLGGSKLKFSRVLFGSIRKLLNKFFGKSNF
jgi:hypothetical protein